VLSAAQTLLVEEGQEAVTPTRLAELTGISRSTIYRHWEDPIDIVFEAAAFDTGQLPFTPSGEPGRDLTGYLKALRDMLESPQAKLLATQIDRAEHNPEIVETLQAIAASRRDLIRDLVEHPSDEFELEHALIVGPLIYQRFMAHGDISDELIALVVNAHQMAQEETDA
jgi:AcrR family transcriptional regulator